MANNMQGGMFGSISDLYRKNLGREPDQAGLDWWTQQANSGAVTLADIERNFQGVAASGTDPLRPQGLLAPATQPVASPAPATQSTPLPRPGSENNWNLPQTGQTLQQMQDFVGGLASRGVDIYAPDFYKNPEWQAYMAADREALAPVLAAQQRQYEEQGYVGPSNWLELPPPPPGQYDPATYDPMQNNLRDLGVSDEAWARYMSPGGGGYGAATPIGSGAASGGQPQGGGRQDQPPAGTSTQQQEPFQQPDPIRPVRYDLDFTGLGDPNIERQRVEDAIFARMNPQLDRARAALETRLANQGITQGSEAYRTAIDENNRAANDARIAAILSGGQEQSRLFGLGLNQAQFQNQGQNQEFSQGLANAQLNNATSAQAFNQALAEAQFQNQANQSAINQALMERQIPLNEIIALMSGSQVQQPSFVNTAQTPLQGTDITGNIYANYQGAVNQYNQRIAQQNAMLGGLFGLGGTLGGAYLLR